MDMLMQLWRPEFELDGTRDCFDATASNWNTSAHRAPWRVFCIKTGNQIRGWVYSRFDHVIHGGLKYTNFLASGRGISID